MNNYSWLEQNLHRFALSTKLMREAQFDIELNLIKTDFEAINNVFVAGVARSGTTILLNAIHESNEFASLSYADMPFILAPNLWSRISNSNKHLEPKERAHGDGIKVSSDSPEAFEEVFWKTFSDTDASSHEKFRKYVNAICHRYNKKRYLSKNNQNIKRLELFAKLYPDSVILIPFRDPHQHINSLLSQHLKFIQISEQDKFITSYMGWIGHTEFGVNYSPLNEYSKFNDFKSPNHWLEQWCISYQAIIDKFKNHKNYKFICYEKLCDGDNTWKSIQECLRISKMRSFQFKLSEKTINFNSDKNLNQKASLLYEQLRERSL